MPSISGSESFVLTPFERYDRIAQQCDWLPCALSDTSVPHSLSELQLARVNCGNMFPSLMYDLTCEIAWRETIQQMREVERAYLPGGE